jgi:hypothetical protein
MNMLAGAFSFAARDGLVAVAHLYTDVCENERNEAWQSVAHIEPARTYRGLRN